MILISKFLSSCGLAVVLSTLDSPGICRGAAAADMNLLANQADYTADAAQPVVVADQHVDQIKAAKGDKFEMTAQDGQSGGTLEVTVVDADGKATHFNLNGILYYWSEGRYWATGQFHSYCFEKLSRDVYDYEKRDGNNAVMDSGSAVWTR